jgi:hypothetical protein
VALAIRLLRDKEEGMGSIIPGRRLWLTADGTRLVEDGDLDARSLFCGPGDEISEADAIRFGIKASPPPEDKAVKAPSQDKGTVEVDPESEIPGTVDEAPAPKRIMEPQSKRQRKRTRR